MNRVPRHALLSPSDADKRLGSQRFSLGDRVVYVLGTGKVPIALRGTVVGITRMARQTWLDIVFDMTFMSGTNLGDRCSPFRGASVPSNAVLNLSDRQVVATSRASEARRQPAPAAQPLTVAGYGAPLGAGGRGQSFPAGAPPPLQGSYRNAATTWQGGEARSRGAERGERQRRGPLAALPPQGERAAGSAAVPALRPRRARSRARSPRRGVAGAGPVAAGARRQRRRTRRKREGERGVGHAAAEPEGVRGRRQRRPGRRRARGQERRPGRASDAVVPRGAAAGVAGREFAGGTRTEGWRAERAGRRQRCGGAAGWLRMAVRTVGGVEVVRLKWVRELCHG